jgi:predicted transcriptional regulator
MANTSIQVSEELLARLKKRKMYARETYEEVIEDLLEDVSELSEETKKSIARAEKDIAEGRVYTFESIKKELGL